MNTFDKISSAVVGTITGISGLLAGKLRMVGRSRSDVSRHLGDELRH